MENERILAGKEYPSPFFHIRINDCIVMVADLSRYLLPNTGDTIRRGMNGKQFEEHFNVDDYETEEEFMAAAQAKLDSALHELAKFLGIAARLHSYINHAEHALNFPGAKTVVSTGYRLPFEVSGKDDYLAANFSFSNAYLAEKNLKGAGFFLDNIVIQLLCGNRFYRNIIRHGSFVTKSVAFNMFMDCEDVFWVQREYHQQPLCELDLFRKKYWFQEMNPHCLSYLQVVDRLTDYLNGTKSPLAPKLWLTPFNAIKTGPSEAVMTSRSCKKLPLLPAKNDIEEDIRVFSEVIETGESQVLAAKVTKRFSSAAMTLTLAPAEEKAESGG